MQAAIITRNNMPIQIAAAKFVNGKALVKVGRRTIAKIFDRPVFLSGLKVSYSKRYNVEIGGMSKESDDLGELISDIENYCGVAVEIKE